MSSALAAARSRPFWVVLGCLVCQMGLGYSYSLGALAPYLLDEFGWTRAELASTQAAQIAIISLASPVVGYLTVRFGGRAVLAASCGVLAAAFAGAAGVQSWLQLALAWAGIGIAVTGLGDISVGAVVTRWVTGARGLALGLVYTGSNLGGFAATRVAALVAERVSWRAALATLALGAVGLLLPFALFAVRDRQDGAPALEDAAAGAGAELPASPRDLDARAALATRSFWLVALSLLAFWIYLMALLQHLVLFLVDGGLSREAAAGHLANAVFMGLFSKVAFGWLADRLSPKSALLLDFGLVAASSLLLLALPDQVLVWAFVAVFGFSYAARDVVTPLIVTHCFGERYLAQIYGVLMLTFLPGGTLGPIFAGWVHDRSGAYTGAFAAFAALNVLAFAALTLVRDERRALQPA